MQKFILNTLLITLVFSASITLAETDVMCTQEAKQCPDGSYVGRTGPNCEFAKCPNSVSTSTSATPRQGLIQKLKNVIENKKEVREEVKNKIQDRVSSTTAQRIENRFEKIAIKYLRTIEREEAIMAKIVSRIEKIKVNGGNVVEAEKLVAEAKVHLEEARTAYATLKTAAVNTDNATSTKQMLDNMKTSAKLVEKHIREAHKSLQKIVGVLRGVSGLRNATSTESN